MIIGSTLKSSAQGHDLADLPIHRRQCFGLAFRVSGTQTLVLLLRCDEVFLFIDDGSLGLWFCASVACSVTEWKIEAKSIGSICFDRS